MRGGPVIRRKAPCPGCGRSIAVRTATQSMAGAGGKHRAPHKCPHGRDCVFGSRFANNGLNPGNMRHVMACRECATTPRANA